MDKQYKILFSELAKTTSILAEQVMDYDHEQGDEKGEKTATVMRDDFMALHDKIEAEQTLEKNDYAKLLVGSYIVANNLRDKIRTLKESVVSYDEVLIPRLKEIVDSETDDVTELAEKIFILDNNK